MEDQSLNENRKIPVIKEQLHVSKEWKETGRVQLSKTVTEEEVDFKIPVQQEEVVVERKEINRIVEVAPPVTRHEGDVIIISVLKEVLVVEKKLMLVEELHLTKRKTESMASGTETVRIEHVDINQKNVKEK